MIKFCVKIFWRIFRVNVSRDNIYLNSFNLSIWKNIYFTDSRKDSFYNISILSVSHLFNIFYEHLLILILKYVSFLDEGNGYTSRFLGFSVYISNTTNKENGVLCFKDTSYTRATIPNPTDIPCAQHGKYVIYYNDRSNPPYPAGYDTFAYNELCELQVLGESFHKSKIWVSSEIFVLLLDRLIKWSIDRSIDRVCAWLTEVNL